MGNSLISIGFFEGLTLTFIILKLMGKITWSWIWVLSPSWIPIALALIIVLVVFVIVGIMSAFEN